MRLGRRAHRGSDVAVYAPLAGPLYRRDSEHVIGGAETQSTYLARSLATQGFRVVHLVFDREAAGTYGGVRVVPIDASYSQGGIARRRAVVRALRASDAEICIQRSAGFETGVIAAFSRATGRRFVFSSSSEADFARDPLVAQRAGASLDEWRTRAQYLVGLRLAHAVVVQTNAQRALARSERGVDARVIRSFCEPAAIEAGRREVFLWVGGLTPVKNPLAFVDLAALVPEAHFRMIASRRPQWDALGREVVGRAEGIPNLELSPAMPREALLDQYASAAAIVSTSWFEGFPNTFLEAWARGTPALSLYVDPDGVIERHGLGAVVQGSLDRLADHVRARAARPDPTASVRARAYVEQFHDPSVIGSSWAALVEELSGRSAGR